MMIEDAFRLHYPGVLMPVLKLCLDFQDLIAKLLMP